MKPRKLTTGLEQILAHPGVHIWAFRDEMPSVTDHRAATRVVYNHLRRTAWAHVSVVMKERILLNPHDPYDSEPCMIITVDHATS